VREISLCRFRVEQGQRFLAAKRRKNTAHGESPGYKWEMIHPNGAKEEFSSTLFSPRNSRHPTTVAKWRHNAAWRVTACGKMLFL
jgi:hypothetical protein